MAKACNTVIRKYLLISLRQSLAFPPSKITTWRTRLTCLKRFTRYGLYAQVREKIIIIGRLAVVS